MRGHSPPIYNCGFLRKRFLDFYLIIKLVYRAKYIHGIAKNKKGNKDY